jgi:hypothetical protein
MDAHTFDRWTVALAERPTRRGALRLLAGSALGALLARGSLLPTTVRAALQADRDGDGLFDDDEVNVYGTNPDVSDTDGDGVGDGEEVYLGTDPLTAEGGAPPQGGGGCPAGQADCGAGCMDISSDPAHCGACGAVCDTGYECVGGTCQIPEILVNDDITQTNERFYCEIGLTECYGACVDLANDVRNCGICGYVCGDADICTAGQCVVTACAPGTTNCDNFCTDLFNDQLNCGACGNRCAEGLLCCLGNCVNIANDRNHCGGCGHACAIVNDEVPTCVNYQCY